MAELCAFDEVNCILSAPEGMEGAVDCLGVAKCEGGGLPTVVSCWKLTESELREVLRTKRVWIGALGESQPPLWVSGRNPFGTGGDDAGQR